MSSPLTVVHIITSLGNGGAEGALYRLIKGCRNNSTTHKVICLTEGGVYRKRLEEIGIVVESLNMPKGRLTIAGIRTLSRLLKATVNTGTVVQTWMYHADLIGGLVARLVGHKRIFWGIRNNHLDPSARMTMLVVKACATLSRWVPTRIIACSNSAVTHHIDLGYKDLFSVIYNGYDVSSLFVIPNDSNPLRDELNLHAQFSIGMVARWDPIKDHETLFKALSLWSKSTQVDFRLLLVGSDCDAENHSLRDMLQKYSLENKTHLLGQRSDIPAIMNSLDLHVLSSKSESFPNVIAEAMACGTRCLSTNVGDAADIIGDTGWLVEPESPDELAEGLRTAYAVHQRAPAPSIHCRNRIVDNFSLATMINAYQLAWRQK